jgi:hypothetical protein
MGSSPEPALIEERFGELFKAARILLRKGVSEETIIPTLAYAYNARLAWALAEEKNQLISAWTDPEAWRAEAELFAERHPSLRLVEIVDGLLVVERLSVYAYVHTPVYVGEWDAAPRPSDRVRVGWDTEVVIAIYPHSRQASSESVASLYREATSANGLAVGESDTESLAVERRENYTLIIVKHRDKTIPNGPKGLSWRPVFPPPDRVGAYYGLLMGTAYGQGFASHLNTRKRGRAPEPDTLIPACVALYLRPAVGSRVEVHKMLNEHVLRDTWKKLPEESYGTSKVNQLWRDVEKVRSRLEAASHPLYNLEPEWIASHNRFLPRNLF